VGARTLFNKRILVALLSGLLFVGCGEDVQKTSTSTTRAAKKEDKKKTVVEPPEEENGEEEEESVYTYIPDGKRDPFRSLLDIQRPVAPEQEEPLTPLQRVELQQLALLGVVVGLEEPKAMVLAPGGKSYILKKGTKVGKNNGKVIDINSEGVFIEETYYDFAGQVKTNTKSLKLPSREGDK